MEEFYTYIGVKIIEATPMSADDAGIRLGRPIDTTNGDQGYLVEYEGGYQSWSPAGAFEKAYRQTDAMSFGLAIEVAKKGKKIARKGWNGKNMFVVFMSPMQLPPFSDQTTNRKVNDRTAKWIGKDTPLDSLGYFAMFTADRKWQPGWLASQSDMLSDDWVIVE